MLIRCPECETEYDIDPSILPEGGRKLKCSHCSHAWFEGPPIDFAELKATMSQPAETETSKGEPRFLDPNFDDEKDRETLERLRKIEEQNAADSPPVEQSFRSRRPRKAKGAASFRGPSCTSPPRLVNHGPVAKPRKHRAASSGGLRRSGFDLAKQEWPVMLGLAFIAISLSVVFGARENLARAYPDLVSLYATMGYEINTQGIDILGVRTKQSLQDDIRSIEVSGQLVNVSGSREIIPPIRISLVGEGGEVVYSWGIAADATSIGAGEVVPFRSRVADPPLDGKQVKVAFVGR